MNLKFIGIAGPMLSGKSTAAGVLAKRYNAEIIPFAAPLKAFAKQLGWNGKKDERGRRLLQLLGTECGRQCIDPDIWVKQWIHYIETQTFASVIIADDVRFENEATKIRELGGKIIHLDRPGYDLGPHASEQGIEYQAGDIVLDSGGNLVHYKMRLLELDIWT